MNFHEPLDERHRTEGTAARATRGEPAVPLENMKRF